jgi:hypothetical protein
VKGIYFYLLSKLVPMRRANVKASFAAMWRTSLGLGFLDNLTERRQQQL